VLGYVAEVDERLAETLPGLLLDGERVVELGLAYQAGLEQQGAEPLAVRNHQRILRADRWDRRGIGGNKKATADSKALRMVVA
jgi:hypothetical protein